MNPKRKAVEGEAFSRLLKRGARANHARKDRRPGGKDAVIIMPERIAGNIFIKKKEESSSFIFERRKPFVLCMVWFS